MPQFLKLLFGKVIVEFVLWGLRFASVVYHAVQSLRVEDALHTLIHLFGIGLELHIGTHRAVVEVGTDVLLQVADKRGIAFARYHRQAVHLMYFIGQHIAVLPDATAIHTEAQAASHLLPLLADAVRLAKRTYLKHVGIVPSLAQSRMREYEAHWLVKTQQTLLVLQYKVVGRDVIGCIRASLGLAVHRTAFLVNGKVTRVRVLHGNAAKVGHIIGIEHVLLFVQLRHVFLLEYLAIASQELLSVLVIFTVVCHLVDEEFCLLFQFIQKAVKVGKESLVLDYSVLLIFPQRLLFCLFMGYASCIRKNVMVVDGQEFD